MRSPREILFGRHESAQPDLEKMREQAVARMRQAEPRQSLLHTIWLGLFWEARRSWLVLGSAWAVIITLNLAAGRDSAGHAALQSGPMPADSVFALEREWKFAQNQPEAEPDALPTKPAGKGPHAEMLLEQERA